MTDKRETPLEALRRVTAENVAKGEAIYEQRDGDEVEQGYVEATVIVEGAVDGSSIFGELGGMIPESMFAGSLDEYISKVAREAKSDGLWTEVYILEHFHPLDDEDCECAQYVTDGRPAYSWNEQA
jgi:hypothetical protein